MAEFEKHTPYYWNGTTWKKVKAYIKNGTNYSLQQPYVALDIPILNAFILPTTTLNLSFEKRGD